MTVIVGVIEDKTIYMGADSRVVCAGTTRVLKDPKVFHAGSFLIGASGSRDLMGLLRYNLHPPEISGDLDTYMRTTFVEALRKCLANAGVLNKYNEVESFRGVLLVGVQGRLFEISARPYCVLEHQEAFNAIGSGEDYALGSLASTVGQAPQERIRLALEAAACFNLYVGPPFIFDSLACASQESVGDTNG